jgi:metal-responsive CopG/Arc/MetJ family transcriptional regulator
MDQASGAVAADRDGFFQVRLPKSELDELSRVARLKGYSRGEFVRLLVRRGLVYARDMAPKETLHAVQPRAAQST